jgi:hypothetical protein
MLRNLQIAAILSCMLSYAAAGTVSIGTASVRGDMRVDNYLVKGNATLFNGSVVETDQATANLRLNKGAQITLSTNSRGTMYSDHAVLQQGETQVIASNSFQLQAGAVHVFPNQPNSVGIVTLKPGNTVEVASLTGSFGVSSNNGIMLANVHPGRTVSFAMQAAGASQTAFSGLGIVSFENGTYYLTTDEDVKYVLTCHDSHRFVGDKVYVTGTVEAPAGQAPGVQGTLLCVKTMDINGPGGMSRGMKWLIAGIIVGGAIGAGIALSGKNNPTKPASIP